MDDEILQEFIVESTEALDHLDVEIVRLEQDPTDTATLSSIFRRVHTIKGTCGFLGFAQLESVTHTGESLLSRLRDGELAATPEIVSTLLELVDVVRAMMGVIVERGEEGPETHDVLVSRLAALAAGEAVEAVEPVEADGAPEAGADEHEAPDGPVDDAHVPLGERLVAAGHVRRVDVDRALARQREGDPRHVGEILVAWGLVTPDETLEVLTAQQQLATGSSPAAVDGSIRVDVALLDRLMNLVGELVLTRNQVVQHAQEAADPVLAATLQRLDLITTELQAGVVQTRMQPIEGAWAKYPRIVRDLSRQCGKEVALEMHGGETELDKTLLEAIKDPLAHVVRNAIDHGIEPPEVRESRGKPRRGTLTLRASHESGRVVVEIADDGGGIDPVRVRDLAIERGVVSAARAERMSPRELTELVFAPGFSTAEHVSTVSGRGVGMDVVRTNIAEIGGTVDLQSEPGDGTTLRVRIPLTLAIIPALIVGARAGDGPTRAYAIPQVSLLELLRLDGEHAVEHVHGVPVVRLRGTLLPLVHLNQQLADGPVAPSGDHVVVLQSGERTLGVVVDSVRDTAEIVVKPLDRSLRDIGLFAGATIMGDGTVALILDAAGLAAGAGLGADGAHAFAASDPLDAAARVDATTLLLFRLASDRTYAMELSDVARLEEFDRAAVEASGRHDVVQYRGGILRLSHVADVLEGGVRPQPAPDEPVRAIVHRSGGTDVGLVVGEIADIVHRRLTVDRELREPGLAGSTVIDGIVADVVDVPSLLAGLGMDVHA